MPAMRMSTRGIIISFICFLAFLNPISSLFLAHAFTWLWFHIEVNHFFMILGSTGNRTLISFDSFVGFSFILGPPNMKSSGGVSRLMLAFCC